MCLTWLMGVGFLHNGPSAPWSFLKFDLLGRDLLSGGAIGRIVRMRVDMRGVFHKLWEVIIDIQVDFILGVGVVMQGLIDGALQGVLLLSFEEVKQRLIVPSGVPVALGGGCTTHLTIL